jgi:hypothetical protein
MCRLRLGAKCLHWSPATCDSLIWDSVDKWLKPDQPWHLQYAKTKRYALWTCKLIQAAHTPTHPYTHRTRAMLLLHCYESHQMTGRHLAATNHKPDAVATLSLVMELLHSPQVLIPPQPATHTNHPSFGMRTILTLTHSGK